MAFIALALLARYRKQPILTGLFLAIAILLKFYPLVLFPALYRHGDFKMPATVASVIAVAYAAYSSVGMLVLGFLGGYAKEEGLATGTRYFLLELAQRIPGLQSLTTNAYLIFCAAVFAAILWWCWQTACQPGSDRRSPNTNPGAPSAPAAEPSRRFLPLWWAFAQPREPHSSPRPYPTGDAAFLLPAFALAAALMFLFSPHYAWYIIWLVPFFTLMPNLPILAYLLGFFYLYTTALADPGPRMFLANEILYAAVLAALMLQLVFNHWPLHRTLFLQNSTASEPL